MIILSLKQGSFFVKSQTYLRCVCPAQLSLDYLYYFSINVYARVRKESQINLDAFTLPFYPELFVFYSDT